MIETIDGGYDNAFNTLQDAISKAYEIGAPYESATIIILLKIGIHAMLRSNQYRYYMPTNYDTLSQTTSIIIDTEDG